MFNFESPEILSSGLEKMMADHAVEALCHPCTKFRVTGRAVLLETTYDTLLHLQQSVTVNVEIVRWFMRPALTFGYNHLPSEFTRQLPILVTRTFDGLDAYFGMTPELDFHVEPLG